MMASTLGSLVSTIGIDKVNMDQKLTLIEEHHGVNGAFMLTTILSNAIKNKQAVLLVLFHNTFEHYHNIGMRVGFNLRSLVENKQVVVMDHVGMLMDEIEDLCGKAEDFFSTKPTLFSTADKSNISQVVQKLSAEFQENYRKAEQFNKSVVVIIDDLSHLLDLGLNQGEALIYFKYIRSSLDEKSHQLYVMIHSYPSESLKNSSNFLINNFKYMAQLIISIEPLKASKWNETNGKLTISWQIESVRKENHWAKATVFLYRLMHFRIHIYPPGAVNTFT
ncbi:elongator complex protein 6 [Prorops nasuta]|uniref:elongator complex protein 6 n=1 Tax=Prorops nasuta TaxID=863751 RepID=UPI0034CF8DBC